MKISLLISGILVLTAANSFCAAAGEPHEMETWVYVAWQGKEGHPDSFQDITVPIEQRRVRAVAIKAALSKKFARDFSPYSVLFRGDLIQDKAVGCLDDSILAKDLEKEPSKSDYPTVFTMTKYIQMRYNKAQRAKKEYDQARHLVEFEILNEHLNKQDHKEYNRLFMETINRGRKTPMKDEWATIIEQEQQANSSSSSPSSTASSASSSSAAMNTQADEE